jgi:hypothetical protein
VKGPLAPILLVGLAAVGVFFLRGMPREVTLVYGLDDFPAVRGLEVDLRREGEVLRHAEFRFPAGAPAQVRHEVRLPDGVYEVLVRVSREGSRAGRALLPLAISESGPVVLPVHDRGARAD